ncbi:MAG TPA: chloride channel protein [Gemmatimonadaceae bacterium]|nr:chloride channel protein [Gemmatimonadaceae bacterium]
METPPDHGAIPVSPGLEQIEEATPPAERAPLTPAEYEPVDERTFVITGMAIVVGFVAALCAEFLSRLIGLVTNIAFYGRWSTALVAPGLGHRNPFALLLIPIAGAIVVGFMARYGSRAIRGHGIPEVMERVLFGESRIAPRVLVLKPLSAAVAIGTGGPFGAEGPIIATGGALGSAAGQIVRVTTDERKTLLGAGAAAGMAATFGTPVSAVLLAVELLLFEYRPRSLIPVALASATAGATRIAFHGTAPVFPIGTMQQPTGRALAGYAVLGLLMGVIAAFITRATYAVEDAFEEYGEHWHIHWMWWPAIGAIVVGVLGLIEPRTLGVGYENIIGEIDGTIVGRALAALVVLKFISWAVYLGSGTSGGTMAPLFTIGAGVGAGIGGAAARFVPAAELNPHVAGLVGMAALFAGASHAVLASMVFAFETTRQPVGLLPLLIGCSSSYLVTLLLGRHSIMTEKLARRGISVRAEYAIDYLGRVSVGSVGLRDVVTLRADMTVGEARDWLRDGSADHSHQGFPVLDEEELVVGVLTRRDILDAKREASETLASLIRRPVVAVYADNTLREAADLMVIHHVGRLPVVKRDEPRRVIGVVSRSDLLGAHAPRLEQASAIHGRPLSPFWARRSSSTGSG